MNVKLLIASVVVFALIAFIVFVAYPGMKKDATEQKIVDATLIAAYCQSVAEVDFERAYDQYFSHNYQDALSRNAYMQAQQKRTEELGSLISWEFRTATTSSNLFSSDKEIQMLYELRYERKTVMAYVVVANKEGEWEIGGTFDDRLNTMVW